MNSIKISRMSMILVCGLSLIILFAFSACGSITVSDNSNGTTTTGSATSNSLTGTVTAVNAAAHSVTISVSANGQVSQYTVNGLSDQQVAALQSHLGKTYTIQATQNNGAYTINTGTDPQEVDNGTPAPAQTTTTTNPGGVVAQGSISFTGKLQSSTANSMNVSMPNGDVLTLGLTATTDRSDLPTLPAQGQYVKVKALANPDGSFAATKISPADNGDLQDPVKLNTVDLLGVTTSAVGADNVLHFNVGRKGFSGTIGATTQLKNFVNAQAIGNNQLVKVDIQYNGSAVNILKVDNGND